MGLIPLFISICTFVYDYYSDIELTFEYYRSSEEEWRHQLNPHAEPQMNVREEECSKPYRDQRCLPSFNLNSRCHDILRTADEFRAAFATNLVLVTTPVAIFW